MLYFFLAVDAVDAVTRCDEAGNESVAKGGVCSVWRITESEDGCDGANEYEVWSTKAGSGIKR